MANIIDIFVDLFLDTFGPEIPRDLRLTSTPLPVRFATTPEDS